MAKRLKDAGIPDAHAEVLVETLREREEAGLGDLVMRADLGEATRELKADLGDSKRELKAELNEVKRELKDDIQKLERRMDGLEQRIETKIAETKFDLVKWVAPIVVAQFLALAGLYFK